MDIEFRDRHGRKVNSQRWARGIEEVAFEQAERALELKINAVLCPEHGRSVTNLRASRESGGIKYEWQACCEKLTMAVERALQ